MQMWIIHNRKVNRKIGKLFSLLPCKLQKLVLLMMLRDEGFIIRKGWVTFHYDVLLGKYILNTLCRYYYIKCYN
jgi:hypothetical protein